MGPLEHSTSSCFMKGTWQGWGAQPASQGACCSSQCLRHPPVDSGQQGCMSSASHVCNRDRLLFVHSGLPGGASVCWLFPEWDGPMAGAPGVPGHGPSSWARTLRLRERPRVSEGPPVPSRESGTPTRVHQPQSHTHQLQPARDGREPQLQPGCAPTCWQHLSPVRRRVWSAGSGEEAARSAVRLRLGTAPSKRPS